MEHKKVYSQINKMTTSKTSKVVQSSNKNTKQKKEEEEDNIEADEGQKNNTQFLTIQIKTGTDHIVDYLITNGDKVLQGGKWVNDPRSEDEKTFSLEIDKEYENGELSFSPEISSFPEAVAEKVAEYEKAKFRTDLSNTPPIRSMVTADQVTGMFFGTLKVIKDFFKNKYGERDYKQKWEVHPIHTLALAINVYLMKAQVAAMDTWSKNFPDEHKTYMEMKKAKTETKKGKKGKKEDKKRGRDSKKSGDESSSDDDESLDGDRKRGKFVTRKNGGSSVDNIARAAIAELTQIHSSLATTLGMLKAIHQE